MKGLSRLATFAAMLMIGIAGLSAVPARAQCEYPTDLRTPIFCYTMFTYPNMTMSSRACIAILRNATYTPTQPVYRGCAPQFPMSPTSYTGVTNCSYIMGQRRLYAKRPFSPPVTMAFCEVVCDCGVLRIDETDGLPVELMDFSVGEGEDDQQSEGGADPR